MVNLKSPGKLDIQSSRKPYILHKDLQYSGKQKSVALVVKDLEIC